MRLLSRRGATATTSRPVVGPLVLAFAATPPWAVVVWGPGAVLT